MIDESLFYIELAINKIGDPVMSYLLNKVD